MANATNKLAICLMLCAGIGSARAQTEQPTSDAWLSTPRSAAVVVLVGEPGQNPELALVLTELLEREGVEVRFVMEQRFQPSALMTDTNNDASVWVFITLDADRIVHLYFRGPFGQRFLLRQLNLLRGLDEVGRESIAQVVTTSIVALIHSSAGIDREAALADLAREAREASSATRADQIPMPAALAPVVAAPKKAAPRARIAYELSTRAAALWAGAPFGVNFGFGAETGLTLYPSAWFFHRERLALARTKYSCRRTRTLPCDPVGLPFCPTIKRSYSCAPRLPRSLQ